jgi:hypothetical protein
MGARAASGSVVAGRCTLSGALVTALTGVASDNRVLAEPALSMASKARLASLISPLDGAAGFAEIGREPESVGSIFIAKSWGDLG